MPPFFKKDNFLFGIALGITSGVAGAFIAFLIDVLIGGNSNACSLINRDAIYLITVVPSLFLLRYYLRPLHFIKTGKGILLIAFILVIMFFVLKKMNFLP